MNRLKAATALLLLTGLLAACSGSGFDLEIGEAEPEIDLEETGIYRGTVETDEGDVVLMELNLGRDGITSVALQEDDSERATRVLWGTTDGGEGSLFFTGTDTSDDADTEIDISVDGGVASGRLDLNELVGEFSVERQDFSDAGGDLSVLAGDYGREDNIDGFTRLVIDEDGTAILSGACGAEGTADSIDTGVNLYRLRLSADCAPPEFLLSRQNLVDEGDVLSLVGSDGTVTDLYRN